MKKWLNIFNWGVPKHFENIDDLPIYNWFRISESNNLKYLFHKQQEPTEKQKELLQLVWSNIYLEFLETFGVPKKLQKIFSLKREILKMETRVIVDKRKDLKAAIILKKKELENITKVENQTTVNTVSAYVSKELGFRIDQHKTTVREFYEFLSSIEKQKEAEAKHLKSLSNGKRSKGR